MASADKKAGKPNANGVNGDGAAGPDRILLSVFSHRFMSVAEVGLSCLLRYLDFVLIGMSSCSYRPWELSYRRHPSRTFRAAHLTM